MINSGFVCLLTFSWGDLGHLAADGFCEEEAVLGVSVAIISCWSCRWCCSSSKKAWWWSKEDAFLLMGDSGSNGFWFSFLLERAESVLSPPDLLPPCIWKEKQSQQKKNSDSDQPRLKWLLEHYPTQNEIFIKFRPCLVVHSKYVLPISITKFVKNS